MPWRLLVFGATGAIGGAAARAAVARGWTVIGATRGDPPADRAGLGWRRYDPLMDRASAALSEEAPFDAVCFAQGANFNDSFQGFDAARHLDLYRANVLSVMAGLSQLVEDGLLRPGGARLVAVSSIWQTIARSDKLSYTVTKAAVGGLVRAASVDLGKAGHMINAVLPGATDTPMTRANLTAGQIAALSARTTLGRLPDLETLSNTILFLCSEENNAINGQSIAVDLGMSHAHLL